MKLQRSQTLKPVLSLFQSRLSWRIGGWIFLSIAAIGTVLVLPTVANRHQELLDQVEEVTDGKISWILETYPEATGEELAGHVQQLYGAPMLEGIIGGAVYDPANNLIETFGEPPTLAAGEARQGEVNFFSSPGNARYDSTWLADLPSGEHAIVIRHNASGVRGDLYAFILRQGALMLMISAFVTLVMMVVLGPTLMHPILTLRQDLAKAGASVCEDDFDAEFASTRWQRQDELGEVIATFREMYCQICQAITARKQVEAELRHHNVQMQEYLAEVNQVTRAATTLESGTFDPVSLQAVAERPDELGKLARVLQQAAEEVKHREMVLQRQVAELKIEIDQSKRQREVAEITQSSYFQDIQQEISRVDLDEFWS
jgi:hypothetical protein